MTLSLALQNARASLAATSLQSAVVSRNVTLGGEAGYQRRVAHVVSGADGARIDVSVTRFAADDLRDAALSANAGAERTATLLAGVTDLARANGDPTGSSLSNTMSALRDSLNSFSAQPDNIVLAGDVLNSAQTLVQKLNSMSAAVGDIRARADRDIASSVERINEMLVQFKESNARVISGLAAGRDASDFQDQRDRLLAALSNEIGIVARPQKDGGLAIFTDGGAVLFDREPRAVRFTPTLTTAPGGVGSALFIDGVDVTSLGSAMPVQSGRLSGLFELRDTVALTVQAQVDDAARGLIEAFAETDQSATPVAPDLPGLFTTAGATGLPGSPAAIGLAGRLIVNPTADPAQGGVLMRLRDGGLSDPGNPAYVYNKKNMASFSARIDAMARSIETERAYDPATGLEPRDTPLGQSSSSLAWISAIRRSASTETDRMSTLRDVTNQTLSNATGVNIDDEMAYLLEVERTYQASAKIITTVDQMFGSLLQAVG